MLKKIQKSFVVLMAMLLIFSGMPYANHAQAATEDSHEQVYEIYPKPHDIEYKGEVLALGSEANVVYDSTIDDVTKKRVKEVFDAKNITLTESEESVEGVTNILVGTNESDEYVHNYFAENIDVNMDLFSEIDPYILSIENDTIAILGGDTDAAFYGVTTLQHIFEQAEGDTIRQLRIDDYASTTVRGFIEGFYGIPWSDEDRMKLMEFGGQFKMNSYVFAPKDDPYHRDQWDDLYPAEMLADIEEMVQVGIDTKNHFVWTISPLEKVAQLAQNFGEDEAMEHLEENTAVMLEKFDQLYEIGVRDFGVHGDDVGALPYDYVVQLMNSVSEWAEEKGDINNILFTPASYNADWAWDAAELNAYEAGFADDIEIFWTGSSTLGPVVQSTIDTFKNWENDGVERRDPAFWLNWPVNDVDMSRVFLGKGEMLQPGIKNVSGVVTNPMQESEASKTSLFAVADYAWNTVDFDDQQSWEDSFKYIEPDATEELHVLAKHMSDAHPDGIRTEESEEIKDLLEEVIQIIEEEESLEEIAPEMISELQVIANAADDFLAKTNNEKLKTELEPFANSLRDTVLASVDFIETYLALEAGDKDEIWTKYANGLTLREQSLNHDRPMLEGTERARPSQKRIQPFTDDLEEMLLPMVEDKLGIEVKIEEGKVFTNVEAYNELSITEESDVTSIDDEQGISLDNGDYLGVKLNHVKELLEIEAPSIDGLTLETSLNGIEWEAIEDKNDIPNARYVRLINKTNESIDFTLDKFNVKSVVFEAKSMADTNYNEVENPLELFDGDLETYTYFRDVQDEGKYVTYDLGQVIDISSLEVYVNENENDYPRHAVFETSLDGENWETIMEIGNQDGPNEGEGTENDKIEEVFDNLKSPYRTKEARDINQDARYLRHRVTRSKEGPVKWAKIQEIVINDGEFIPEINDPTITTNVESHQDYYINNINDGRLDTKFRPTDQGTGELTYHIGELEESINELTVLTAGDELSNATVSIRTTEGWNELGSIDNAYSTFDMTEEENVLDVKINWNDAKPTIYQIELDQSEREAINKSALQEAINRAGQLEEKDYTKKSWETFTQVLEEANDILIDEASTQSKVDQAVKDLEDAIEQLKKKEDSKPSEVDKSDLDDLVNKTTDYEKSDYTKESFEKLEEALKNAQTVLADDTSTQEDIDNALSALETAINGLKASESSNPNESTDPKDPSNPSDPSDPSDENESNKLPSTATSMFNWLLVGTLFVLIGGLAIYVMNRRKQSAE